MDRSPPYDQLQELKGNDVSETRLSETTMLDGIVQKVLSRNARSAIFACARLGLCGGRDFTCILIWCWRERTGGPARVAAAFGFLASDDPSIRID